MREILLVRHAESTANVARRQKHLPSAGTADNLAILNLKARLTDDGAAATMGMNLQFREQHIIVPEDYKKSVAASEYVRTQETAHRIGFHAIEVLSIINEVVITPEMHKLGSITARHQAEHWVPAELQDQADEFIDMVRSDELPNDIYFSHGFFGGAVITRLAIEHEAKVEEAKRRREEIEPFPYAFDDKTGYIAPLATIRKVIL